MIQTTEMFAKNDHKSAVFHETPFYGHEQALCDELLYLGAKGRNVSNLCVVPCQTVLANENSPYLDYFAVHQ